MKRLVAGAVLLAACSSPGTSDTLLSPTTVALPDVPTTSTTQPPPAVEACDPAPFVPTVLPDRVAAEQPPARDVPYDLYTIVSGTSTSVWSQEDGAPVLALIRGAFPPVLWVETPEVISIRDVDAALGQLPGDAWGVAWYEGDDRCDEYSIILYPPTSAEEARRVAESLVEGQRAP